MAAKFEVYKSMGKTGGFRWRLRAANGQAYKTKAAAKKGVAAAMKAASKAEFVEV